jgi:hypothetical protein
MLLFRRHLIKKFSLLLAAQEKSGYFLISPCYSALAWKNQTTINFLANGH